MGLQGQQHSCRALTAIADDKGRAGFCQMTKDGLREDDRRMRNKDARNLRARDCLDLLRSLGNH